MWHNVFFILGGVGLFCAAALFDLRAPHAQHAMTLAGKRHSVEDRLAQFGAAARARLQPHFAEARLTYPPRTAALVTFKDTKTLHMYARGDGRAWRLLRTYRIQATSGALGPKLKEGDRQVPEGLYRVVLLNPNSRYHVSLRLDYPNAFDRAMAARDARGDLGGDIMIHGKAVSIGCLAMGDEAIEELFTLAADIGHENVSVLIAPSDLRVQTRPLGEHLPAWTHELYEAISAQLRQFPAPI